MAFSLTSISIFLLAGIVTAGDPQPSPVKVRKDTMRIFVSETKAGNVLPQYLFLMGPEEGGASGVKIGGGKGTPLPFVPSDSCDDDIFEGANPDLRSPQLPYLTQDVWDCARAEQDVEVVVMENDKLRATIVPQWGGKIWSLYDKVNEKEMFYSNPSHQPANIGALKAWASGGCEFNWSPGIIGHSAFTESPVYLSVMDTEKGPAVRVYEYDRYNHTAWQVDIMLEDDLLWIHPKVTNPTSADLRGYWWTCVAHSITPNSRVITPATATAQTSSIQGMSKSEWPRFNMYIQDDDFQGVQGGPQGGTDNSYLGNFPENVDVFVRIYQPETPYIALAQEDGYTIVHGHELNGTKFFTWGVGSMGHFWQDFLAGGLEGQGDYAELQTGPAPTQMQTWPLPRNSTREWTEWFKAFPGRASTMQSPNYSEPLAEIKQNYPPSSPIASMKEFLTDLATRPTLEADLWHHGASWGGLYEMLTAGESSFKNLFFGVNSSDPDVRPWVELVKEGRFSNLTLSESPTSFMTTDLWLSLIDTSASKFGSTWLHNLHLGICHAERGSSALAEKYFEKSLQLKKNAQAYRSLAVLNTNATEALALYKLAWATSLSADYRGADRLREALAQEICRFLHGLDWLVDLDDFLNSGIKKAPNSDQILKLDHVLEALVRVSVYVRGDQKTAVDVLSSECFPTFGFARIELIDMWNDAHLKNISHHVGRELTPVEAKRVRKKYPVPKNLGCAYTDNTCTYYDRD